MEIVEQVVQIVGALLILAAFAAQQMGRMPTDSHAYLVLNLIGGGILAVLAYHEEQWGFLLLETVWTLVSGWSLWRLARGLPVAGAGH